jgi:hypothetical protein
VNNIEGIPEGWELVRVGHPVIEVEWVLNHYGDPILFSGNPNVNPGSNWPIIRKIERPKRHRAFANAAEFEPHRDRWIRQTLGSSVSFTRIDGYGKEGVTIQGNAYTYQQLLDNRTFDDGSPFGVEVTE